MPLFGPTPHSQCDGKAMNIDNDLQISLSVQVTDRTRCPDNDILIYAQHHRSFLLLSLLSDVQC